MSKTHWLQSPNKNYLGHWDLPESGELIVTIASAQWEAVKNPITNTQESKRVIRFQEEGVKPMICNQTNAQAIVNSTGVKFMEDSAGQKVCLTLGKARVMREEVDCIRIKPEPPYTLESLRGLYMEVEDKVAEGQKAPIEAALKEGKDLGKIYKYLIKLK